MSPDIAAKVLDESANYDISVIDVGESADSFSNPKVLDILRLIRLKSHASVRMFTNFRNFTPDKIDIVLEEGLLDKIITNIDGATPQTYHAVKRLDLKIVESNILYFLRKKEEVKSSVYFKIQALTLNHYVRTVKRVLGRNPLYVAAKYLDAKDDFQEIVDIWKPRGVIPQRSIVTLWAESENRGEGSTKVRSIRKSYAHKIIRRPCRLFDRIKKSLFVMPSGEVYLCCADFNFELILGNVSENSVKEIVEGQKRERMLEMLEKKRFDKIGGPCILHWLCRLY